MIRAGLLVLVLLLVSCKSEKNEIIVGSKKFTESVILGEIIKYNLENSEIAATHKKELGGTRVLFNALKAGKIDIYPEYSGTILNEILAEKHFQKFADAVFYLDSVGIGIAAKPGFNNTYALGVKKNKAQELNLKNISDLNQHPDLQLGFTNEFMDRGDGWKGLRDLYGLGNMDVTGLDHDLAYVGLENGSIDVLDVYSTDAEIKYYDLVLLNDDKHYFPEYYCVILYNKSNVNRNIVEDILHKLEGSINESQMAELNSMVKVKKNSESEAAAIFLSQKIGIIIENEENNVFDRLVKNSVEHVILVSVSMFLAVMISIPLGFISFYYEKAGKIVLWFTGILQTIPSLAILVFMIPLFGIGSVPAIAALFLYSLLPIVRNTYLGLAEIPRGLRDSAIVLGLSKREIMQKIELPLSLRSIFTGIKTASVINIGTATLGALIGAGGYGQPILTGIRLDNTSLILEGAIPAAILAIFVQYGFDLLEKIILPRGLTTRKDD